MKWTIAAALIALVGCTTMPTAKEVCEPHGGTIMRAFDEETGKERGVMCKDFTVYENVKGKWVNIYGRND